MKHLQRDLDAAVEDFDTLYKTLSFPAECPDVDLVSELLGNAGWRVYWLARRVAILSKAKLQAV